MVIMHQHSNRDGRVRADRHRHVTTACEACRKKRCKCDGQVPCEPCMRAEEACVYTHNDRRRQQNRHSKRGSANGPGAVKNSVEAIRDDRGGRETTQIDEGDGVEIDRRSQEAEHENHDTIDTEGTPDRLAPQGFAIPTTETLDTPARQLAHHHRIRPLPLAPLNKNGSHPGETQKSRVGKMKDMQGKFKLGTGSSGLDPNTGRLSRRELVSKAASEMRKHDETTDGGSKPKTLSDLLQPRQYVWQLRRRPYVAPGYTRTFGNLPFSSSIKANGYPVSVQARQALNFSAPQHMVFPITDVDESPLGRALSDFQQLGRRLIAEGAPAFQVADQGLTDVTLFFRERLPGDPVNASTWTAEMLRSFRGTFSDELLLACAIHVTGLMRWLLVPSLGNYASVPSMIRPTDLQRIKPHSAWIDLMMFPSFRNALTNRSRDWVEPCMKAQWALLWPRSLEDALHRPDHAQQIFLTAEFASYVDDPKNWSMQRSILEEFPEIQVSEINIVQE